MTINQLYDELSKLKIEMTPEERLREYLAGKEVDCIPYGFRNPGDALANVWGITKGELHRSFEARAVLTKLMNEEYGINEINVSLGLRGLGGAVGSKLFYPETRVEYIEKHVLSDYHQFYVLEQFNPLKNSFFLSKIEDAKRMKDCFPNMTFSTNIAGPLTSAVSIRPIEKLLKDFRKNSQDIHKLLDFCVDATLQWVELYHRQTGGVKVDIADPLTTTDILGPQYFRTFSKPWLKRLVSGVKKITGRVPSVHLCGHTKKIWSDLIEIGINNLSIDNCEKMIEAKETLGDYMFLSGNIPPVEVMKDGSIDEVIECVRKSIADNSDSPKGYMVMTGCQVPIGTPKENFDAYVYAVHKYGKNARIGKTCGGEVLKEE